MQGRRIAAAALLAAYLQQLCSSKPGQFWSSAVALLQPTAELLQHAPGQNDSSAWLSYLELLKRELCVHAQQLGHGSRHDQPASKHPGTETDIVSIPGRSRSAKLTTDLLAAAQDVLGFEMYATLRSAATALHMHITTLLAAQQRIIRPQTHCRPSIDSSDSADRSVQRLQDADAAQPASVPSFWPFQPGTAAHIPCRHPVLAWPQPHKPLTLPASAQHRKVAAPLRGQASIMSESMASAKHAQLPAANMTRADSACSSASLASASQGQRPAKSRGSGGRLDLSLEHIGSLDDDKLFGSPERITWLAASNNVLTALTGNESAYALSPDVIYTPVC